MDTAPACFSAIVWISIPPGVNLMDATCSEIQSPTSASHPVMLAGILATTDGLVVSRANIAMRAPYDPRSATQTFEMWTAAQPPKGFTWGYDSRSTTETYVL